MNPVRAGRVALVALNLCGAAFLAACEGLPGATSGSGHVVHYTVVAGDSLASIAVSRGRPKPQLAKADSTTTMP